MEEEEEMKKGCKIRGEDGEKYRKGLYKGDVYDTIGRMRDRLKVLRPPQH